MTAKILKFKREILDDSWLERDPTDDEIKAFDAEDDGWVYVGPEPLYSPRDKIITLNETALKTLQHAIDRGVEVDPVDEIVRIVMEQQIVTYNNENGSVSFDIDDLVAVLTNNAQML
jgi:hypothetical protein